MQSSETHTLILASLNDLKKSMDELKLQINKIDDKGQHNAIEIATLKTQMDSVKSKQDTSFKYHDSHFTALKFLYILMGGISVGAFVIKVLVK